MTRHISWLKPAILILIVTVQVTLGSNSALSLRQKFITGEPYNNKVNDSLIHTVLLHSATWELSQPVIELGTGQQLELRFDDLRPGRREFAYTLVHCDGSWNASNLQTQEYLSGFGTGLIREITGSFNTTFDYTHYRLVFPEEDCMPLISGNYALVVYEEQVPEKPVLIRRFFITEKSVNITGRVKQPPPGNYYQTGQQVEFSISFANNLFPDPSDHFIAVIMQNNRSDNALVYKKPFSFQPGKLEYNGSDMGIFEGGNEFRSLDLKSMKYQTENMAAIDFQNPYYHIYLKPDESREFKPYFSKTDLNGDFFIDREKSVDKHSESDYVFVHFRLNAPPDCQGEEVFVTGAFRDWEINGSNKMSYNVSLDCFEVTLLMKQGLYDYCYAVKGKNGEVNEKAIEGTYYETRNDYTILIYYYDSKGGYSRLTGWLSIPG
jgi:hypothetical protein